MRLKDLVMQTTYEKIEPAIKTKYDSKGLVYDDQKKMKLKRCSTRFTTWNRNMSVK